MVCCTQRLAELGVVYGKIDKDSRLNLRVSSKGLAFFMTNNNTLTWRVQQLEKCVDDMDKKMDTLLENHLPHLDKAMGKLETRINVLSLINVGAIVLALLINGFL